MSGEITLKKNTTNTQSTNNEESNKVHYHLSANVKFDKDNAFNGEKKNYDNWVNKNEDEYKHLGIINRKLYSGMEETVDGKQIYYIKDDVQIDYLIDNNNDDDDHDDSFVQVIRMDNHW